MQAIPWPVSPEFEDALVLATQRHLAQPPTAPSTPQQHSLDIPSCSPDPDLPRSIIPRSSSLMMKTRVAVRDKTPHRFQVVPLRDAAQNREKCKPKLDSIKQPLAPWTRQLALLRPSGVGLGLNMPTQPSSVPDTVTPERGRGRTPRQSDRSGGTPVARKGILRGLQGASPKRQIGSPDRKENRMPMSRDDSNMSPTKRGPRRRGYTLGPARQIPAFTREPTTQDPDPSMPFQESPARTQENSATDTPCATLTAVSRNVKTLDDKQDITITEDMLSVTRSNPNIFAPGEDTRTRHSTFSRHFKSPSLGTIHYLLSVSASASDVPNNSTPRVRCRKRTNTLSAAHASTKRYGVYTPGKIDFSPVVPQEDASTRIASTYSLGALLSAYSYDSLPSMYSQESFVTLGDRSGTQPLRVSTKVRVLQGRGAGVQPHAIVVQLIRDVDEAIVGWI